MIATTESQIDSLSVNDTHKKLVDRLTDIGRTTALKVKLAIQVQHERMELRTLSEQSLKDIGIERHSADCESCRSIFDVPKNRTL